MSSSQRAESSHSFFKQYVHMKHSLIEFIIRFNRAIGRQHQKKVVGDHNDENRTLPLQLRTLMEKQMAKLYTRLMFEKFQVEELKSLTCFLKEQSEHENEPTYEVLEKIAGVTKMKSLVVDTTSDYAKFSCKKMEFRGLPCRHILAYLRMRQIKLLQECYILKRWLQTAKCIIVLDMKGKVVGKHIDNSIVSKRAQLLEKASDLIDKVVMSKEGTALMSRTLEVLDTKLNYLSGGNRGRKRKQTAEGAKSSQPEVLKDPIQVKRKGVSKTSTKEKQSQNWRRMGGKNNSPWQPDRSSFRNELEEHTQA